MTNKIFYIAEIGINHNGNINTAKKMISQAKIVGFDAVKFQKRNPELSVPKSKRDILRETPWGIMTYLDYKKRIEFGKEEYDIIDEYCKSLNISWFASAWDFDSVNFLKQYDLPYNKIASTMITNTTFLTEIAKQGKYTFISTGMCDITDIDSAVKIFSDNNCPFCIMHSVAIYPCPEYLCNISMIKTLKDKYQCDVGYSGHEEGLIPSVLSGVYGVCAIERHITLDRAMWGTDQSASLEKRGQELLIRDTNTVKLILGNGIKTYHRLEKKKAEMLRNE